MNLITQQGKYQKYYYEQTLLRTYILLNKKVKPTSLRINTRLTEKMTECQKNMTIYIYIYEGESNINGNFENYIY